MMKRLLLSLATLSLLFLTANFASARQDPDGERMSSEIFSGLELRSIGPAFMSGRIADIAIHPGDDSVWYVAVGSGGVWKTINSGTTWTPIFDDQSSYSIGCVTIDPNNPDVIWVGTGEDVGGRHVGYGDGIYRSDDGGKSWKNMGLEDSEHIARILVHPGNSDVVWAAAQGPLWSSGGHRGLYKTTDGGHTWDKTLGDDEWTGVTDLVMDPRDPDQLYAATWQRHRTVAAYMGGGPGSGIHRSTDGGVTWKELTGGLLDSNMGKIGLALSPQKPDIVYAAIELDRRTGGFYRSDDRGSSWVKMSDAVSGGTGPHYYQELYASPHHFERLYLMDASMQVSEDGGKTFYRMNERYKHGDNHAMAFRTDDPNYVLFGTDGGLYESFDLEKSWKFVANLPVTQYYKVALDDTEPFYNIYGGTQDNGSQGGPSRTDDVHGIRNSDWHMVLNWDGHQPATEPGNPDIMYAERQQGALSRLDLSTGEVVHIQPQPGQDEDYERYNWDAPILVSSHDPARIYFASQRVWRSDNRGDSWTAVSEDLTNNQERLALPIMGSTQSWDSPWDVSAMSNYNTITSLAESPIDQNVLYAGTDDGLIQVTGDGGGTWTSIDVGNLPGLPKTAFVNDIKADLYDANTVYAAFDNHKYGDFAPYLYRSTDRGQSWESIGGDLPGRTLVWRLVQDHVDPDLLFAATEFGLYFTVDGGQNWTELSGGVPTISFRDLALQRRENDLVGASFGRGFYVLDDYTALREVSEDQLAEEAILFGVRDAWWYFPRPELDFAGMKGSQGDAYFVAPNPPFGAVFTYYLRDGLKTLEDERHEQEEDANLEGRPVAFPGWERVEAERRQADPSILFTVEDEGGNVVRRIEGPVTKGVNRVAWDLRYPASGVVSSGSDDPEASGMLAAPGTYTVTMSKRVDGRVTTLSESETFEVVPLHEGSLVGASYEETAAFWRLLEDTQQTHSALQTTLQRALGVAEAMQVALARAAAPTGDLDRRVHDLRQDLLDLDGDYNGLRSRGEPGERTRPTVGSRLFNVSLGVQRSTYGPTPTHREQLTIAQDEIARHRTRLEELRSRIQRLGELLEESGAPWVEGQSLPDDSG